MRQVRFIMGMPVIIDIKEDSVHAGQAMDRVFDYFYDVDQRFSTYKKDSEICRINQGVIAPPAFSRDMKLIFELAEKTRLETDGYFDILNREGEYDPSGIVKGWAIRNASHLLIKEGMDNFSVEAGGDIQVYGQGASGNGWVIGIKNPFNQKEIVKVVVLKNNEGIATSGSYERENHVYNPKNKSDALSEIVSLTVIGPDVYEADRFATAAFAMGRQGIQFIETLPGFEAYMIDHNKIATMTSGFQQYVKAD